MPPIWLTFWNLTLLSKSFPPGLSQILTTNTILNASGTWWHLGDSPTNSQRKSEKSWTKSAAKRGCKCTLYILYSLQNRMINPLYPLKELSSVLVIKETELPKKPSPPKTHHWKHWKKKYSNISGSPKDINWILYTPHKRFHALTVSIQCYTFWCP